ncbi:NF038122 family metalloprotease [uncultured Sphingomonas sp.]|uniref:NF038122 family metalloprotease n=1 Tax=uncultured Sphingomonas sp. TaxID=158754 RepID=UPI0035CC2620
MTSRSFLRAAVAVAALSAAPQAQALTFVLNNTGGAEAGTNARNGFDIASAYWSSVLTDNITVRLNIGIQSLGTNILGSTSSVTAGYAVADIYGALAGDVSSALDGTAVANLRPLGVSTLGAGIGAVTAITNAFNAAGTGYVDTATRIDNDGSANNSVLSVNTANAKALGAADAGTRDGTVIFSSNFAFDYNPTDGIDANKSDFIGVAIHEIGHALGFVSGVDTYDAYTAPGAANTKAGALEVNRVMSVLDLYRYSSAGNLDWSTQNTPYFSVDGGVSQLYGDSRFSMGQANGDTFQASHWKAPVNAAGQNTCGIFIGIMNPYLCGGLQGVVTGTDLAAFDAIGYNLRADVQGNGNYRFTTAQAYTAFAAQATPVVPEPATWAMMIAGFGMVGASMRRRTSVRFAAT